MHVLIITLGNNFLNWNLLLFRHVSKHWENNETTKEASTTVNNANSNSIPDNEMK